MRTDGLRRLGWAALSGSLWIVAKILQITIWPPLALAELAMRGSDAAHGNSLPVPDPTTFAGHRR